MREFTVRRARLESGDWLGLTRLRTAVGERLMQMEADTGQPVTADLARSLDRMAHYTDTDRMYLVIDADCLMVACYALTAEADRAFWTPEEQGQEALYLDSVMVHPWSMHQGIGGVITARALREAAERKMDYLRLDCQRGNKALRAHWEKLGFSHVRDVTVPGRASGTLMQREV